MKKAGCIFIDRSNREKAIASIETGMKNLPKNYSILMFPEGTRSKSEQLLPFKKGLFSYGYRKQITYYTNWSSWY